MRNLIRAEEVYILANAIESMVFQIQTAGGQIIVKDGATQWKGSDLLLYFNGQMRFRISSDWRIFMVPLSGEQIPVWKARWWSFGDLLLKSALKTAVKRFSEVTWKVKLQDYRALFGNTMVEIIQDLATLMEQAEAEAKALAQLDKTKGGSQYHPQIERMLQIDGQETLDDFPQTTQPADRYHAEGD